MRLLHYLRGTTFEDMRKTLCLFVIIFFVFYTLFCSISQNKPGRHKVPFVVMCHKCIYKKLISCVKNPTCEEDISICSPLSWLNISYKSCTCNTHTNKGNIIYSVIEHVVIIIFLYTACCFCYHHGISLVYWTRRTVYYSPVDTHVGVAYNSHRCFG